MASYCSVQGVRDRVSDTGVLYVADDDNDGSIESTDDELIQSAIDAASVEIDLYLTGIFDSPRSLVGNEWLSLVCVDLAVERFCERKGRKVEVFSEVAQRSRDMLSDVAARKVRIPGVVYPGDQTSLEKKQRFGLPLIANPRGR